MVRKTWKAFNSLVLCLYFLFITLFGLCDYLYPDSISKYFGEEVEDSLCFSYVSEEVPIEYGAGKSSVQTQSGTVLAFGLVPLKSINVNFYSPASLIPGGELFGVKIATQGLIVAGIGGVQTPEGSISPGADAGILKGDILLKADGSEIESAADFVKMIAKSGGQPITLVFRRGSKEETCTLTPAKTADGSTFKAGLWVRDGAAGIGTVTYMDPVTKEFAGLGHAICDSETGVLFPLARGSITETVLEGISRGENGTPGEINGSLGKNTIGKLFANTKTGVYGALDALPAQSGEAIPIGLKNEVQTDKAHIVCTLDGSGKKEYEIEIEEIIGPDAETKNFILRVTDSVLLEKTGGIIQGMSGSPIIQNGKLIGAVTHVLVNNSTKGYGIFIENMLKNKPSLS